MMSIKSLTKINESTNLEKEAEIRHKADVKAADEIYKQDLKDTHSWRYTPRIMSSKAGNKAADNKADLINAADARKKAAKVGMASKQDLDDSKFDLAKAKHALQMNNKLSEDSHHTLVGDKIGVVHKIGRNMSEHPLAYLATAAGLVGLAAMQKRKNRLPEHGQY